MPSSSKRLQGLLLVAFAVLCGSCYSFVLKPLFLTENLFGEGVSGRNFPVATTWTVYLTGLLCILAYSLISGKLWEMLREVAAVLRYKRRNRLLLAMLAYTGSLLGYYLLLASSAPIGEINFALDFDGPLAIVLAWIFLKGEWSKMSKRSLLGVAVTAFGWWLVLEKGSLPSEAVLLVLTYVVGAAVADVLVKPIIDDIKSSVLIVVRGIFILVALGIYGASRGEFSEVTAGIVKLVSFQSPDFWRLYLASFVLLGIFWFRFAAYRYVAVWELNSWMFLQGYIAFGLALVVPGEAPKTDEPVMWGIGAAAVAAGLLLTSFRRHPENSPTAS